MLLLLLFYFRFSLAQHLTGLADKVWRVQTPEDIAKWREDRKRNFPTAARVAARKRELKERKKRGNVLNNQYFGKINGENNRWVNSFHFFNVRTEGLIIL